MDPKEVFLIKPRVCGGEPAETPIGFDGARVPTSTFAMGDTRPGLKIIGDTDSTDLERNKTDTDPR